MPTKPPVKRVVRKSPTQIVRDAAAKAEAAAKATESKNVSKKPKGIAKKVSKAAPKAKKPVPRKRAAKRSPAAPIEPHEPPVSLAGEETPVLLTQAEAEKAIGDLPVQWQLFIEFYLTTLKPKEAALRAGYAEGSASETAHRIRNDPRVVPILRALESEVVSLVRMSRERIIDEYAAMAEADATELSEHLRVPCRHCWGKKVEGSGAQEYQLTPYEWESKRELWENDRQEALAAKKPDPGPYPREMGDWYDKKKPINPDCGECHGYGYSETFLKDTRNLSRHARAIYAGTEEGKDGIKIKTWSKESALGVLAKSRKVFDDSLTVNMNFTPESLEQKFGATMAMAHERQAKVRAERFGVKEDGSAPALPSPEDEGQQG